MSGDPHPITEAQESQRSVVLKLTELIVDFITNDPNQVVHASLEIEDLVDGEPVKTKFVFSSSPNYEKESDRG